MVTNRRCWYAAVECCVLWPTPTSFPCRGNRSARLKQDLSGIESDSLDTPGYRSGQYGPILQLVIECLDWSELAWLGTHPRKDMDQYILEQRELLMAFEMFQVLRRPGLEAIHANNFVALCKEEIDEV